mgnify:CR=1 FL=1
MEKWNKFQKFLTRDNMIIMVLVGILLFVIALPVKKEDGVDRQRISEENIYLEENLAVSGEESEYADSYAKTLEMRLEEILSKVDGVGEVKVMVTLAATEEVIIEKNESVNQSVTKESDQNGGAREISQIQKNEEEVTQENGTARNPLIRKKILPVVEGVIVVAKGGGNGTMDKKVTEMVQAVTGLEAHKVIVAKMR